MGGRVVCWGGCGAGTRRGGCAERGGVSGSWAFGRQWAHVSSAGSGRKAFIW